LKDLDHGLDNVTNDANMAPFFLGGSEDGIDEVEIFRKEEGGRGIPDWTEIVLLLSYQM
jgi:hypothetical protein